MPVLTLPDPPPSDGVVALRGFEPGAEPLVQRPQREHRPDVFYARRRG